MFCGRCGAVNADHNQFCGACGQPLSAASSVPGPATAPMTSPYIGANPAGQTSSMAIASLICGILAFLTPAAIAAIIMGHISRSEIRKSAGRLKGSGMALAGLILGYLGIAIIPLFLIIAAIAIPNLIRSRMVANEFSAMATVRVINTAEVTFASRNPDIGFTCDLSRLAGSGLIDNVLAGRIKSGYRFRLNGCAGTPAGSYFLTAYPLKAGTTGRRVFCSDQTGMVRYEDPGSSAACSSSSPELQ